MPVRMCDSLKLQEFSPEFAGIDVEGPRGWRASRKRLGEEFVVCFGDWGASYRFIARYCLFRRCALQPSLMLWPPLAYGSRNRSCA